MLQEYVCILSAMSQFLYQVDKGRKMAFLTVFISNNQMKKIVFWKALHKQVRRLFREPSLLIQRRIPEIRTYMSCIMLLGFDYIRLLFQIL